MAKPWASRIAKDRIGLKPDECRQRSVPIGEKIIRPKLPRSQRQCDFLPSLAWRTVKGAKQAKRSLDGRRCKVDTGARCCPGEFSLVKQRGFADFSISNCISWLFVGKINKKERKPKGCEMLRRMWFLAYRSFIFFPRIPSKLQTLLPHTSIQEP